MWTLLICSVMIHPHELVLVPCTYSMAVSRGWKHLGFLSEQWRPPGHPITRANWGKTWYTVTAIHRLVCSCCSTLSVLILDILLVSPVHIKEHTKYSMGAYSSVNIFSNAVHTALCQLKGLWKEVQYLLPPAHFTTFPTLSQNHWNAVGTVAHIYCYSACVHWYASEILHRHNQTWLVLVIVSMKKHCRVGDGVSFLRETKSSYYIKKISEG